MDPVLIRLISACTALVASIAGPSVTLLAARRQSNANVLSANRQKWIETLRDAIAEFISLLVAAMVVKANWKEDWQAGRALLAANPALLHEVERMVLSQCKIRLLINRRLHRFGAGGGAAHRGGLPEVRDDGIWGIRGYPDRAVTRTGGSRTRSPGRDLDANDIANPREEA